MTLPAFANPSGGPRPGQWVKFALTDPAAVAKLVSLGAHLAPASGHLVGIFAAAQTAVVQVAGSDGATKGPAVVAAPDRLVVVDADGNDVFALYKDKATGNVEKRAVFFRTDDPLVCELHPLLSWDDFPPGRARHAAAELRP